MTTVDLWPGGSESRALLRRTDNWDSAEAAKCVRLEKVCVCCPTVDLWVDFWLGWVPGFHQYSSTLPPLSKT